MAQGVQYLDYLKVRKYLPRYSLSTRILVLSTILIWIAGYFFKWLRDWGALVPSEVDWSSLHRLTTYPFINVGWIPFSCCLLALAPLLDRFELENGTLTTLALFTGPFNSLPGLSYLFLESVLLRRNSSNQGSSTWIFLLLAAEFVKSYRTNPFFRIGPYRVPTLIIPFPAVLITTFFIPHFNLLGNLSGIIVGYLWGFGYIKFLAPPERILKFIEGKLNLMGRLPHFVSTDKKTYGRYGVLDMVEDGPVT